eukprot:XP_019930729.1 PREDICTED: uncharacterized protein LOC109621162 [Crassostrea gigas]
MSRNPNYDNRATLSTNIISTLIFESPMRCASHCTRNDKCKSIMINMDTYSCRLLYIHMSDTGPQTYSGWLYYEKKIEGTMPTTATVVSTETTQTTFERKGCLENLTIFDVRVFAMIKRDQRKVVLKIVQFGTNV